MRSTDVSWDEQTRADADAGRLWAGGAATALVAAGVALVGMMVLHRLLHADIVSPSGLRQSAGYATVAFPIGAAIITLLATGLLHLLMATTPRAPEFFGWIASLALAALVLQVFLHTTDLVTQLETAVFYLLVGIAIISSLLGVSRSAVRYRRRQAYRDDRPYDGAYGHPGQAGYRDPGYREQSGYGDQSGYGGHTGYRDEPWR